MRVLLRDPKGKAPWYNATGVTLYVAGMMVAAFALAGPAVTLSWLSIVRLGLVQMALGAIVVLTTSTLNRLMVVELALPAVVPGLLVALHYGIQITRPTWGFASDAGGNRTRWIVGGMAALACGAFGAALGVVVIPDAPAAGLALLGPRLCADRPRRRRLGHLAPGASRHRHPARPPRRRGDGHLDDDDRRHRRHRRPPSGRCSTPTPRRACCASSASSPPAPSR